jgi:hypothetical protein
MNKTPYSEMKRLTCLLLLASIMAGAQTIDVEKTHEVSKEAMKGFIQSVELDKTKQQIDVIYRVRSKKKQMKFIDYAFDYNFKFIEQTEHIVDLKGENLQADELTGKFKPKKFRGEEYEVTGLAVDPNMMGTLVLKKKVTKFSWNWFQLGYTLNTTVAGKLKATTDDEKKFFYWDHIEDNTDGTAMMLVGERAKIGGKGAEAYAHMMNYHFLRYNVDLKKLADVTINFEYPQSVVATFGQPQLEDESKTDYIVVFATHKAKRYTGPKIWGPDATEYTYVRVSYDGKLLNRITFNAPNSIWRIDEVTFGPDGEVFLFGPANDQKDDFFQSKLEYVDEKTRWPNFQLAKFHDGKAQYISSSSMDEFATKLRPQPDGKKGDSYAGRRVTFSPAGVNPVTKEFFVAGQNYSMLRNAKGQITGRGYEDILLFHFDQFGKLMSQYTMNKKNKSIAMNENFFEFSTDGKTLYWSFFDNVDSRPVKELDLIIEKPLAMPKMAKINLKEGTFEKYSEYGSGANFVHYAGILNYLKFTDTNQVNYLGENKKGSSLWFVRVNLDK